MKRNYPNYKLTGTAFIKSSLKLNEKKILKDFLTYCSITAGKKKVILIETKMLQIRDVMEKQYNSITLKDLRGFLSVLNNSDKSPGTQNDCKKVLKRFLKWKYKDWNIRFEELRDVKLKDDVNHERLNSDTMLKLEQVQALIDGAEIPRYKALIMLTYEVGARPEELLKLKWKDLDLENKKVKLHSAKTGKVRTNRFDKAKSYLERYKQEYPYGIAKTDDFVFVSPQDRDRGLGVVAWDMFFKKLSMRSLGRFTTPYILRHTRLSPLIQTLSPRAYETFAGHSLAVGMKYYGHLPSKKIEKEIDDKLYALEELSKEEKNEIVELKKQMQEVFLILDFIKKAFPKKSWGLSEKELEKIIKNTEFSKESKKIMMQTAKSISSNIKKQAG